ncbi:MAG: hypothetical protein LBB45_06615 [Methanobrevibacter sp.]|jgi:hypothetical protein|nr:hypothetical protein [Candidatus Methanovirga basalitermitum]
MIVYYKKYEYGPLSCCKKSKKVVKSIANSREEYIADTFEAMVAQFITKDINVIENVSKCSIKDITILNAYKSEKIFVANLAKKNELTQREVVGVIVSSYND